MMNVALNISGSSLKILSLQGKKVKKWVSAGLPAGSLRDGLILEPKAAGEAINALFKTSGIPRDKVIVSIAGMSFTYRFISLPRVKSSLLEEAVMRAAKKEISLPLDQLYLSWQPIPGGSDEQLYFLIGVPRNLIDAAVQTLKIAGVSPYQLELRPLALARTAQRTDAIVVNLEPDCFDIVFIANGMPKVIHNITPRGEGATLEDNIRRLADELTKTAAFYQSNNPEAQINANTPLLITGDLTLEPATNALLHSEIDNPIENLAPPVTFKNDFPVAAYAAAIGLALKGTLKVSPRAAHGSFFDLDVNLLDGKYRQPKAKPIRSSYIWIGAVLFAAIALLYPLNLARTHIKADNTVLNTKLVSVQRELDFAITAQADALQTENSVQLASTAVNDAKAAVVSTIGTRGDYTSLLQLVTDAMPSGAGFITLSLNGQDVNVRGEADNDFTVIDYATNLEKLNAFRVVRISSLSESVSETTDPLTGETASSTITVFEIILTR
jgi:Tfp pilus assembly protein PilN